MNTKQKGSPTPPAGITMRDIYYVLFRRKWMIAILVLLGLVSSFCVYSFWPFPYISMAKVFIRYIQDAKPITDMDSTTKVVSPDNRGANIMNTELEILTSMDLAVQAATTVGAEKILGKGNSNVIAAASLIEANLIAEVPKDSDVVILQFKANDPAIAQPVLSALIAAYRDKYQYLHLTPGFTESNLTFQTDNAKLELAETEHAVADEKKRIGITSLDEAKKYTAEQRAKTEENLYMTETDMAQLEAVIKDLQERIGSDGTNGLATNRSTNLALTIPPAPSPDKVSEYKELESAFIHATETEQNVLSQFTPEAPRAIEAKHLREVAAANLKAFEDENPSVKTVKTADLNKPNLPGTVPMDPRDTLQEAVTKLKALTARHDKLATQLNKIIAYSAELASGEDNIMQAETERKLADEKYEHFKLAKEQVNINNAVDNKVSNISVGEAPTPPGRDIKQILKATFGVLGFFIFLALGLPFLIEMVLDQSLKNPVDVQARIGMPFFVNIPKTNGHSKLAKLKPAKQVPLLTDTNGAAPAPDAKETSLAVTKKNGEIAAWDERHELRPYFETLRDRLMTYFEMINLTHKPKLVAVTSCGPGAGVTTTAAGLASSLSEIGDGNVLLVSMNVRDGDAQRFYKGKLTCGIEEVLEKQNRDQAQVQSNLFVAQEMQTDDRLPRVLPKRFSHLVPMLKASDYDYIIFDMPPVSEISITPRLARFMDMVLLVIESEKTSRDTATRVASLLAESKTNVGMVLNKNRSYMPKRLEQSL